MSQGGQLRNQNIAAKRLSSVAYALPVVQLDSTGGFATAGGGSSQVSIKEILTSSGGSVMDSTNTSIGVTIRAGSAAGTEYTDGDVDNTPNFGAIGFNNSSNTMRVVSSATPLPVNVVAGAAAGSTIVTVSSLPMVSSATANSNSSALNVRVVGGVSSGVDFPVRALLSSTGTDNPVSAAQAGNWSVSVISPQSSAATNSNSSALLTRVVGGVSSAADFPVLATIGTNLQSSVAPNTNSSALLVRIVSGPSTATDLAVRLLPSSAADINVTATIGAGVISTSAPSSGSSGVVVRQVFQSIATAASTSAFATSTSFSVQSSAAANIYVTAYSITSTDGTPTRVAFYSSGTMTWPIVLSALSSGISGANLANYPYIFKTKNSGEALTIQKSGSSIAGYKVAVSYFQGA